MERAIGRAVKIFKHGKGLETDGSIVADREIWVGYKTVCFFKHDLAYCLYCLFLLEDLVVLFIDRLVEGEED